MTMANAPDRLTNPAGMISQGDAIGGRGFARLMTIVGFGLDFHVTQRPNMPLSIDVNPVKWAIWI
jgi:hypothetical protein